MLPISSWGSQTDPAFSQRNIFCFDLDETLTIEGQLRSQVLDSLVALQKRGIKTVIVTGRPAGWADALIKLLPVDAILAESGACLFRKIPGTSHTAPELLFWSSAGYQKKKPVNAGSTDERFKKILAESQARFPLTKVAADQFGRLYDFAIDFAEFVKPPLSFADADQIRLIYEKYGATAKVSSIHVNGWYGDFSKFSALEYLVEKIWQQKLQERVVYFGDSPNDAAIFEKVSASVGVSNIQDFSKLTFTRPKFVTQAREGDGVAESIRHFLAQFP